MMNLQIQPVYASRDQWEALALEENLSYEVLELFGPLVMTVLKGIDSSETDEGTEYYGEGAFADQSFGILYDECRRWYKESGRVTSVHGAFVDVNPGSADAGLRLLSRRRCHESCATAHMLGAKDIVFHCSCEPFLRGIYLDSWADQCASFYIQLADTYGLRLWIENSRDVDTDPLRVLMKRIRDPRIGVCLDLGHANFSRVPVEQWFDALGEWIGYLHLSDNRGLFDDHLPLGDGTVNWAMADALWRSLGRQMNMTLETGGIQGVRRSIAYLKEHGYFGMGG